MYLVQRTLKCNHLGVYLDAERNLTDSVFRNRGLEVVIDTTKEAEFDFASHRLTQRQVEAIGQALKAVPVSNSDRCVGSVRIREVQTGKEVAFLISQEGSEVVVLIMGLDNVGELESRFNQILRAGVVSLPPAAQELLKGRVRNK